MTIRRPTIIRLIRLRLRAIKACSGTCVRFPSLEIRDKKAPPVVEALVLAFAVTSDPPNRCYPLWLIRPRSETTEIRITGWLNWCFIEPIWLQDNR
jgi:hypothetical protein